jgi:hypothetical protein
MKKLITILVLLISQNAYSATWVKVSDVWEIDKSSIHKNSFGRMNFWIREFSSNDRISEISKVLTESGVSKDFSKYSFTLSMFEIHCKNRTLGLKSTVFYDKDSKIIYRYEQQFPDMESIVPETEASNVLKHVCK